MDLLSFPISEVVRICEDEGHIAHRTVKGLLVDGSLDPHNLLDPQLRELAEKVSVCFKAGEAVEAARHKLMVICRTITEEELSALSTMVHRRNEVGGSDLLPTLNDLVTLSIQVTALTNLFLRVFPDKGIEELNLRSVALSKRMTYEEAVAVVKVALGL